MGKKLKCPKCGAEEILQLIDKDDWEENGLIDKEEWDYEEICIDCLQDMQIKNEKLALGIE